MQINKVEICGVNTSKLKILSEAEKGRLLRLVKKGDASAREQLFLNLHGFVGDIPHGAADTNGIVVSKITSDLPNDHRHRIG